MGAMTLSYCIGPPRLFPKGSVMPAKSGLGLWFARNKIPGFSHETKRKALPSSVSYLVPGTRLSMPLSRLCKMSASWRPVPYFNFWAIIFPKTTFHRRLNVLYDTHILYLQSTVIISGNGKIMEEAQGQSHKKPSFQASKWVGWVLLLLRHTNLNDCLNLFVCISI